MDGWSAAVVASVLGDAVDRGCAALTGRAPTASTTSVARAPGTSDGRRTGKLGLLATGAVTIGPPVTAGLRADGPAGDWYGVVRGGLAGSRPAGSAVRPP